MHRSFLILYYLPFSLEIYFHASGLLISFHWSVYYERFYVIPLQEKSNGVRSGHLAVMDIRRLCQFIDPELSSTCFFTLLLQWVQCNHKDSIFLFHHISEVIFLHTLIEYHNNVQVNHVIWTMRSSVVSHIVLWWTLSLMHYPETRFCIRYLYKTKFKKSTV